VYGVHTPLPITEKTALAPTLHYAIAKAAADQCLAQLKDKVDAVAVRPFNCIGRDHGPQFLVPKLVRHFRERQPEIILGTTSNKRDFVDVRDMAAMYEAVMIAERVPPAVNFCSATAISADDIISTLTDMTGHRIRVIADPQLMRSIDNPYMCGDNSTIRKLGYIPSFSLRDTLAWMLEA
jgi:nucleoside-diphosphate-sugar epimerase